jgi:hypothetical protein
MTSAKPLTILVNSYTGLMIMRLQLVFCGDATTAGWDGKINQCLETEQMLINTNLLDS